MIKEPMLAPIPEVIWIEPETGLTVIIGLLGAALYHEGGMVPYPDLTLLKRFVKVGEL